MKKIINEGKEILKRLDTALNSENLEKVLEEDNNLKILIDKWKKLGKMDNPKNNNK
jgi:hypothetical protein